MDTNSICGQYLSTESDSLEYDINMAEMHSNEKSQNCRDYIVEGREKIKKLKLFCK